MKIDVPAGHRVGMRVPEGGSSCSRCKFYDPDGTTPNGTCGNDYFVRWRRTQETSEGEPADIPEPPNEYCCDYYDWEEGS